jgi:hypothetical protein
MDGVLENQNRSGEDESDSTTEPHTAGVSGTYEDYDVNLDVIPAPNYMYLIKEAHPPALSIAQSAKLTKENLRFHNPTGEYNNPCTQPFKKVEAEIDARQSAKDLLKNSLLERIGKPVVVYGPWIYDKGHCFQPEIHPAEQIWWSENIGNNRQYHLNVFCDASKRFWWRHQMDDGTKLKPWGAPPIKGMFAISFEVTINKPNRTGLASPIIGEKFEVSNIDDYNVAVVPNSDKIYNLVYQNNVLVSFVPHNDAFKVSFEDVGLKPGTDNIVRGFLVIEVTVGTLTQVDTRNFPLGTDPNTIDQDKEEAVFKKVEGHYMFSILRTNVNNGGTTRILNE